jgi:hypothetical protein
VKFTFGTHDQPISIERYDSDGELESVEKIICEYAQNFPIKKGQDFILRTEEKLDSEKNCAFLPLARTWQIYDSNGLDNIISLWVWKIAPRSFLVDQLYEAPIFSKCKR